VMVQGLLDQVAPGAAAQRFHDAVAAPAKRLVWFPHSAHTPQLDEPARFRQLLLSVRDEWITAALRPDT
jgi:pimeloyl-ACP methyl ester carboxylesterase